MKIYVVRHGEVESNVNKTVGGWNDEKLTDTGIKQAEKVRDELSGIKFDMIFCSPIFRTKQTAEIINVNHIPIEYDWRIVERDPGNMLGKSRSIINKIEWNRTDIDRTSENAETLGSGLKRTKEFLDEIKEKFKGKTVLIITHNFISKCIWIIENNITDKNEINKYLQKNDEIKIYTNNKE